MMFVGAVSLDTSAESDVVYVGTVKAEPGNNGVKIERNDKNADAEISQIGRTLAGLNLNSTQNRKHAKQIYSYSMLKLFD